jgi:hypothetical protein
MTGPAPIVLRRGRDQLRLELDAAAGEVELRAWGRLGDRDPFYPSVERLAFPLDLLPLILDALRRLETEATARGLLPRGAA